MKSVIDVDGTWLAGHPLPIHGETTDKNGRGRVLLAGGAAFVPGALRLTGEAALRAGAGKLQMATVDVAAMALGVLVPEAAMITLPADEGGEIGPDAIPILRDALEHCDAFILGPGMGDRDRAATLVAATLDRPRDGVSIVLDAAGVACAGGFRETLLGHEGRVVLTPHYGEMAALTGLDAATVEVSPEAIARDAASYFGAVVVLKANETIIACPDGNVLAYRGGGVGLATGGSGDVLAGIVGGLLSRGAAPAVAAAWAVWLHGEAGRLLGERIGPIGFLARELLLEIPRLMALPTRSPPGSRSPGDREAEANR